MTAFVLRRFILHGGNDDCEPKTTRVLPISHFHACGWFPWMVVVFIHTVRDDQMMVFDLSRNSLILDCLVAWVRRKRSCFRVGRLPSSTKNIFNQSPRSVTINATKLSQAWRNASGTTGQLILKLHLFNLICFLYKNDYCFKSYQVRVHFRFDEERATTSNLFNSKAKDSGQGCWNPSYGTNEQIWDKLVGLGFSRLTRPASSAGA